jgi:hypothetical protein
VITAKSFIDRRIARTLAVITGAAAKSGTPRRKQCPDIALLSHIAAVF